MATLVSNDIKDLINITEGFFRRKTEPSQKTLIAQNLTAALLPQGALLYAGIRHLKDPSQVDGRALTQMQQARDWLNVHGGLSKESILKNFNSPALNNAVTRMDDVAKLQKLAGTAKYGPQADLLNKGIFSSKEDAVKAHELVASASADPEKLLTRGEKGHEAVKAVGAHTGLFGQQVAATPGIPAIPEGPAGTAAIDLSKTTSLASNLNPAMIAAGAGGSLLALGAGHLLKKGVQKYQKMRYGIEPPKDVRTGKQKTFDATYTVSRSLASKAVGVGATSAALSGLASAGAVGAGVLGSGLAPALLTGYVGYKAATMFNKGASGLKQKIDNSRQKQIKIKEIDNQIVQIRQDSNINPADKQQQLQNLNKQKIDINRGST